MPRVHKYRSPSFETADLTPYLLPEDEPLSSKIIEAHQELAYEVVSQALADLACRDERERKYAEEFCLSSDPAYHELRMLWLGWIGMKEETLAHAAQTRMRWLSERKPFGNDAISAPSTH